MPQRSRPYVLLIFISALLFSSCSSTRPEGETEAEVLFKEAETLVEDNRYIMATEKLNQIRSKFPYSYFATPAELLQADILYEQGNYVESAASYLLFKDFHPRHKRIDYVIYRVAESYYKQLPSTFDRDLSAGREAISFYQDLLKSHASSKYAEGARKKIDKIEEMILNREKYVADFYFKTEVYGAARHRCLSIIERFADENLREHCMTRVMLSSLRLEEPEKCEEHYQRFLGLFNNPKEKSRFENAYEKCKEAL